MLNRTGVQPFFASFAIFRASQSGSEIRAGCSDRCKIRGHEGGSGPETSRCRQNCLGPEVRG